jgi:hypothetical protein
MFGRTAPTRRTRIASTSASRINDPRTSPTTERRKRRFPATYATATVARMNPVTVGDVSYDSANSAPA